MLQFKCLPVLILLIQLGCQTANGNCYGDNFWECDNHFCIDMDDLCDGKVHCTDGSDEIAKNCIQVYCPDFTFRCSYGACISPANRCNGEPNCADKSDEMPLLCDQNTTRLQLDWQGDCAYNYMQCRRTGECIRNSDKCDGVRNCADGSDETVELCSTMLCPAFAFQCGYGGCVSGQLKCNGLKDCIDGSDEAALMCEISKDSMTTFTTGTTTTTTTATTLTETESKIIKLGFAVGKWFNYGCAKIAGCREGHCWTYCGLSLERGDSCFTKKTSDGGRVQCTQDSECDPCWKCANTCSLWTLG